MQENCIVKIQWELQNRYCIDYKHSLHLPETVTLQTKTNLWHVLSYSEKMQTPFLTVAISAECFPLCHIADGHFQPIYLCHQHMGQTKQIKWSLTASKSSLLRSLHSPEQPRCQHGFCIHHRADEPSHRSSQFLKR